ncbi:MAG: DUF885 domain-containing protein [Phycisphaerales bacterium]|nr:DUF885 domain-containing protein [Phycisphaerales bacterium]
MNHPILRLVFVLLALLGSSGSFAGVPDCPDDRDAGLWGIMNQLILIEFAVDPIGVAPLLDGDSRNGKLGDITAEAHRERNAQLRMIREDLRDLDTHGFTEVDQLDADLLAYWLDDRLAMSAMDGWMMPVGSMSGPQVWLPQPGSRVRMLSEQDRKDYLTRLRRVPIVIGDTIDNMRLGMDVGRVPPRVIVLPAVAQCLAQASTEIREDASKSPFYKPFTEMDASDPLAIEARKIISERIVPVYTELALFLQNEYIPACRDTIGAADGFDGIVGYNASLMHHTTLALSAQQIHTKGLDEVARIKGEMIEVIRQTDWYEMVTGAGLTDPPVWAGHDDEELFARFVEFLRTAPEFYYTEPQDLLDGYRAIGKMIDGHLPELFSVLPRLPYGVLPLPAYSADSGPTAYYYSGSAKTGRAGNFMANLSRLDQRPKYEMLALTLHEAMPGHHLQIALAQEIEGQHPIRKRMGFTGFVEGWGLYAEKLGLDMGTGEYGLYSDPYDNFGRLSYEMWRAMRLVVDTGIHSMGWSRDQAIGYMQGNSALSLHNIEAEVDRYIGWPGQATGYKIGELKILELRARAKEAIGDSFDLREFHFVVLGDGALPLPVLEAKVKRWIATQIE